MSNQATRFVALRAKYLLARVHLDGLMATHATKYGHNWTTSWLDRAANRKLETARAAIGKTETKFSEHLTAISPRDWSYGVPAHWLYEKLTFEDALRPVGEPLSVVPPLAYGANRPRT